MITISGDLRVGENANKNMQITKDDIYSGTMKTVSWDDFSCSCEFDGKKRNPMLKDSMLCEVLCTDTIPGVVPVTGECGSAYAGTFGVMNDLMNNACSGGDFNPSSYLLI